METKFWKIIKDYGFYTRAKAVLKRKDGIFTHDIEFWYDSFKGENFSTLIKVIMRTEWMTDEEREDLLQNMYLIKDILFTDERKAKIIFNKTGAGNITPRITLPATWIKHMGLDIDNREVNIKLIDNRIIIEKI